MKFSTLAILTGGLTPAIVAAWLGRIDPGTLVYAASTVIGFLGVLIKLTSARRMAEAAAQSADAQRLRDANDRDDLNETYERHIADLKRLIDENTDISRSAFREANQVNTKIVSLGQTLIERKQEPMLSGVVLAPLVKRQGKAKAKK